MEKGFILESSNQNYEMGQTETDTVNLWYRICNSHFLLRFSFNLSLLMSRLKKDLVNLNYRFIIVSKKL